MSLLRTEVVLCVCAIARTDVARAATANTFEPCPTPLADAATGPTCSVAPPPHRWQADPATPADRSSCGRADDDLRLHLQFLCGDDAQRGRRRRAARHGVNVGAAAVVTRNGRVGRRPTRASPWASPLHNAGGGWKVGRSDVPRVGIAPSPNTLRRQAAGAKRRRGIDTRRCPLAHDAHSRRLLPEWSRRLPPPPHPTRWHLFDGARRVHVSRDGRHVVAPVGRGICSRRRKTALPLPLVGGEKQEAPKGRCARHLLRSRRASENAIWTICAHAAPAR